MEARMPEPAQLVNWPETLLGQIIARRWVLFIGSGVSASCVNDVGDSPPTWKSLLEALAEGIGDDTRKEKAYVLIASQRYLQAAEHIRWCYRVAAKNADYLARIREAVQGPVGHPFEPSGVYSVLLDLDPTTVVTTNYDRLFEIASKGAYDALTYDDEAIAANVRKGLPVLLKLHGRIDQMHRIILTRQDYLTLKKTGAHALDTLRSLFQTHTTLFVGYSIEDPDVQLLLEQELVTAIQKRTTCSPGAHTRTMSSRLSGISTVSPCCATTVLRVSSPCSRR